MDKCYTFTVQKTVRIMAKSDEEAYDKCLEEIEQEEGDPEIISWERDYDAESYLVNYM